MSLSAVLHRVRRLAVATLLLVLLGAGSAAAYWTTQASLESRATAATVGLEQSLTLTDGASPLAGTYSAENLALAGTVTITNTGSRAAEYTLAIGPGSASSPALPAAVQVAAAPVADALDCSPGATLSGARTGTLETGVTLRGELGVGVTATVCVQTSLTSAAHATLPDGTLELAMTSSLAYAQAAQWQIAADQVMTVTQSVQAAAPVDPGVEAMTCLQDGPWEIQLGFSPEEVEKDRNPVKYRMFIAHADSPDERIELTGQPTDGWYTVVHLRNTSSEVTQLVTSNSGGYGNAWLYVEKKLPGRSGWEPVAQGTFHTTPTVPGAGEVTGVHCGWQQ